MRRTLRLFRCTTEDGGGERYLRVVSFSGSRFIGSRATGGILRGLDTGDGMVGLRGNVFSFSAVALGPRDERFCRAGVTGASCSRGTSYPL